jgi:F0F1-type ATP synthase assembly protein I
MSDERPAAAHPDAGSEQGLRGRDLIGLGGLLAGSVVVFTVLGLLVDAAADSSPVFTLVGVGLGIVAGAVAFWVRVRAALRG